MTQTIWTRELSTHTLEQIFSQTTDRLTQREVDLELQRRDDEVGA